MLVGVDRGVVDADIGESANEQHGLGLVGLEYNLQLGAEERRVSTLFDEELLGTRVDPGRQLGLFPSLEAVRALGAIELATDVDERGLVHLLDKHHGDALFASVTNDLAHTRGTLEAAGHVGNLGTGFRAGNLAALNINNDQHGVSDNVEVLCGVHTIPFVVAGCACRGNSV